MSTGADPAHGFWWRITHSLWLLFPILGFGCGGAGALIFFGFLLHRRSTWISGIVYLALSIPAFVVVGESPTESTSSDWAVSVLMAVWVVTIVHAFTVNIAWLRRQRGYDAPWPSAPAAPLVPPPGYAAAPTGPVDVNSAGAEDLAALPHFGHARAVRAIAERDRLGGFADVFEFSNTLELQPHEFVRIFPLVVANPIAPPAPAPQPPPGPVGQPGRIVDV
ncbi:ComEA family DNA-binding protein [Asanoa iriomotensis]|uniref:Helix-hairpin-helix protein n=1 Tax=Asanoa iriomotensis TaxID=234613 RepID=A0ABQ4BYK3_9ACTN|nr:helix-hairpin-helix domain-containing protein [Asanoa iriomotensis]GIF55613.1 hypothetical protein Air01nite_17080 [Asanoa iriomotensis]